MHIVQNSYTDSYLGEKEDKWQWYRDPRRASTFANKKLLKKLLKEQDINANIVDLEKSVQHYISDLQDRQPLASFKKIDPTQTFQQKFKAVKDPLENQKTILEWWLNFYQPNITKLGKGVHSSWSYSWWDHFDYFSSGGRYKYDSKDHSIRQSVIEFKIPTNVNIEDFKREFNLALPYVKEINGCKYLSIGEATLSEYGCWGLTIKSGVYNVICMRYHRQNDEFTCDNLDDLIKFILENCPDEKMEKKEQK